VTQKKILIYGSREFGRVVRTLVIDCGYSFVGFIDDWESGADIMGRFEEVLSRFPPSECQIAIAIGYKDLRARMEVYRRIKDANYQLARLIHPAAYVRSPENISEGAIIMAGAIIDVNASTGALCVIWPGATLNHDSTLGANVFLCPNATVCGYVRIGDNCFIGAGAVVVDHVSVPANTFLKAGAVYFKKP